MATTTQLRTYTVRPERLDEWVEKWRTLVVPLRRRFGFEVHGSWVDRERGEHIWVISYDGTDSFEEANVRYRASAERRALNLDPSQFLIGKRLCRTTTGCSIPSNSWRCTTISGAALNPASLLRSCGQDPRPSSAG